MVDVVAIVLKLEQLREFVSGTKTASDAIKRTGDEAEVAGQKAKKSSVNWKGIAKWAGGAAALYGAQRYIRGAVSATEDLTKSTLGLQRVTGMDTETSSEWAALAQERNISTKQLQMGLVRLARQTETARVGTAKQSAATKDLVAQINLVKQTGGKDAPKALDKLYGSLAKARAAGDKTRATMKLLGVSQAEIAKGDTQNILLDVADSFEKMQDPMQRASLAQTLFGRSGLALLPVLIKGRKGVQEMLQAQKDSGNYISDTGLKNGKSLIEQQRELQRAMRGLKVQLGQSLLPALVAIGRILVFLSKLLRPLTQNTTAFSIVVGVLAAAFVYYKTVMLIATIAQNVFNASMTITLALVAAIPLLILAIIVVFILLYKKVGWFRAGVQAAWAAVKQAFALMLNAMKVVWQWVKTYWPYLVGALAGPFGIAAVLIVKHFGTIKRTAIAIVDAIKHAFSSLIQFFRDLPSRIGNWTKKIPGVGLLGKAKGFLDKFAQGGISRGGLALVGERGPEVVSLPLGARVSPIEAPYAAVAGSSPIGYGATVEIPVYLDGREIARSVAKVTANKLARK